MKTYFVVTSVVICKGKVLILKKSDKDPWALLASPQCTNEALYLKKRIFKDRLGWRDIAFKAPGQEGLEDDFLMRADKNPNSAGASQILGIQDAGEAMAAILEKARRGAFEGIFIFRHDISKIFGPKALEETRRGVKTLIYEGTNENPTAQAADFVIPAACYAEEEGTFTNFEGRVQRIRKALEPLGLSRPAWRILLELGMKLGMAWAHPGPESIFDALAKENEAFRGLDYKKVGDKGIFGNVDRVSN